MSTRISSQFFAFLSLSSFAIAGCSVATDAEPVSGNPALAAFEDTAELGQACATDDDCGSGSCADGVCCATACDGECEACNLVGQVGTCSPHAAGSDPDSDCAAGACYEGMQESFACNGARSCEVRIVSCGSYACGETACFSDCRSDSDCAADASCARGRCSA